MKKKVAVRKKKLHRSTKVISVGYYLRLYGIGVLSVIGVVAFLSFFVPSVQPKFCANSISCMNDLSVKVENDAVGIFDGQKIIPPKINLAETNTRAVLGASTAPGPKHIYVNLSTQTLEAYQGTTLVMKTFISSGKWHPTPDGDFTIWLKLRSTRMTGGSGADYYDLPNVPYVMYFYNDQVPKSEGFGLHGAYWHDNFGNPMSHGCINMRTVDAESLYNWVDPPTTGTETFATANDPGTPLTISGTPPN